MELFNIEGKILEFIDKKISYPPSYGLNSPNADSLQR